jgi:hypothetical protein
LPRRVACRGRRDAHRVLVGKPEGKRLLGKPRHRWEDNIEIILKIGWTGLIWLRIQVAGSGERGNELWGSIKCEEVLDWLTDCQLLKKVSGALACWCKESAATRDECQLSLSAARTYVRTAK